MSATIRPATQTDIDTMFAITCAVHLSDIYKTLIPPSAYLRFLDRYKPSVKRHEAFVQKTTKRLTSRDWYVWVAEDAGKVCGFTLAHDAGRVLELRGLFVDEQYQGRGIGKQLFDVSCSVAREGQTVSLEVLADNARAIHIYERAGFHTVTEVAPDYYDAPMIRMQKH